MPAQILAITAEARSWTSPSVILVTKMPISPCLSQDSQACALPVEISGGKDTEQNTNFNDDMARLEIEVWIQGPTSFLCLPS